MARYIGASCKLCRRSGEKLFLKGEKCFAKCILDKRKEPPGQHKLRKKLSDYGLQLQAKQKVKRIYGVLEKQFRIYFSKGARKKGLTGLNLLTLLECRLDNVVYRAGFGSSRKQSRQFVKHGHFFVNQKRVNIPSYILKMGDVVSLREKSRDNILIKKSIESASDRGFPSWLEVDIKEFKARVINMPQREEMSIPVGEKLPEQLIVELYGR